MVERLIIVFLLSIDSSRSPHYLMCFTLIIITLTWWCLSNTLWNEIQSEETHFFLATILFYVVSHSNKSFQKFHDLLRSIRHTVPHSKRRHTSNCLIHTPSKHHSSHSHLNSSRHCSLRSNQILILHSWIEQSRQSSFIQIPQELCRQPLNIHTTRTELKLRSHRGMKRCRQRRSDASQVWNRNVLFKPAFATLNRMDQWTISEKRLVELAEIIEIAFNDVLHFVRVLGKVGANVSVVAQTSDGLRITQSKGQYNEELITRKLKRKDRKDCQNGASQIVIHCVYDRWTSSQ